MNNSYFDKNVFPGTPIYSNPNVPPQNQSISSVYDSSLPLEQSYIENILRLNRGKKVTVHMTFPDSNEFRDKEFKGIIEQAGKDHIILSDPATGNWFLLLMIYVDYITFDEKINYSTEFIPNS